MATLIVKGLWLVAFGFVCYQVWKLTRIKKQIEKK